MKTRSHRNGIRIILTAATATALVSALASASTWSVAAEDIDLYQGMHSEEVGVTNGFYLKGDAGAALVQNMNSGTTLQFQHGPRVDVGAGYNITQNIAVELQGGFAHNEIEQINGIPVPSQFSTDLWTVPVMANGIYKYTFCHHWQAYGGAGVGAVISTVQIGGPVNSFNSTDCVFGYQAMLGIKYLFFGHFECGLGYSFLGSLDHHWSTTLILPPSVVRVNSTSPTYMHSFLVTLTYRF